MKRQLWKALDGACDPRVQRIELWGVPVDHLDSTNLEAVLQDLLDRPGANQIVFLRTIDFVNARRRPHLLQMLHHAALVLPVSKGIARIADDLGFSGLQRHYPFSAMIRALTVIENQHGGIYLLGDGPQSLGMVEKNLRQTFPAIRILGRYTGKFPTAMHPGILTAIAKASPNLLLAGNGLKGKAHWIHRNAGRFNRGIQLWSGECFDFISLRKKRANPVSFRKGREDYREAWSKPWRLIRLPLYLWMKIRILLVRSFC